MRRLAALIPLVAALAASLAGCGGDDATTPGPPANPEALLHSTLAKPVRSARTRSEIQLELAGASALSGPVTVELEGPYVAAGSGFPRFDWTGNADVLGFEVDGELVSLGDNLLVGIYGDGYEVGTAEFASVMKRLSGIGFPARELLGGVRYEGREEVDGVEADHVSAELEGEELSGRLGPLADLLGLEHQPVPVGRVDAWIAVEGEVLRKLSVELAFEIARPDRASVGGASGGRLEAEVVLDDVNEPQSLPERPRGVYKPISDLLSTIGELGAYAN